MLNGFEKTLNNFKINQLMGNVGKLMRKGDLLENSEKSNFSLEKKIPADIVLKSSPLDSLKFDETASKLDTPVLVKMAHLESLTDPRRNQTLKDLANPKRVLNETRRTNIQRLSNELALRSKRGDKVAEKIVSEFSGMRDLGVSTNQEKIEKINKEEMSILT